MDFINDSPLLNSLAVIMAVLSLALTFILIAINCQEKNNLVMSFIFLVLTLITPPIGLYFFVF